MDTTALVAVAGNALVQAMVTDGWEGVRQKVARVFGRGQTDARIERRLDAARDQITAAVPADLAKVQALLVTQWETRFADLLADYPDAESELITLVDEIRASLPVTAADHSVAAGRDVLVRAEDASVAAAVIHGNVNLPSPLPGSGKQLAGSGIHGDFGPGDVVAAYGGIAVGAYNAAPRPEVARLPVSLPPRSEVLAGREDLLAELHALLTGGDQPRSAVLAGLGGVGKTSLAAEYARRHLAEVAVAWQIPSEDPALLAASMAELAAQLGGTELADTRDPVASGHAVLAAYPSEWLLIFDNAPDEASIRPFVPPAGRGRVLITSQSQHWPGRHVLNVPLLDPDTAARFLVNRTGEPDEAAARELAAELGGLPLALEQAAAYVQATGTTLARCLALYRHRQVELLARGEASDHPATVAATLKLALYRLEKEAPAAAGLLRLLACLAPEPVPVTLLLADTAIVGKLPPDVAAVLRPLIGDAFATGEAIGALRRYSLVTPISETTIQVHRLVQAITTDQMSAGQSAWQQSAAVMLEAAIPGDTDLPDSWSACALLLPHAHAVLVPESRGMQRIANYLGASGSYAIARDLQRTVADARARVLGPKHPDTLAAGASLAHWTGYAGDPAAARDQYAALLPVFEEIHGPGHLDTLVTRTGLAHWTRLAGDLAASVDVLRGPQPDNEDSAPRDLISVLAPIILDKDLESRRDMMAGLVRLAEEVLGAEHPNTLTSRTQLAHITRAAGDPVAARDLYAVVLPALEKVLGVEHPDTLAARAGVAYCTGEAGDAAAARDMCAALLPALEKVLGVEHPDTLAARANLARWTGEAGDPAAARDMYSALLPALERALGAEHPDTLTTRANLAHWTGEAGDPAAARDMCAALLPALERALGAEDPDTLTTRANLAHWTARAGDAARTQELR